MKPEPVTEAALTVTEAVPVEERIKDCVAGELTATLPKATLAAPIVSVGTELPSCRVNVCDAVPALAVRIAVSVELTVDTVAVNTALAAPAGTVTEAGTVTALLLLARFTAKPPGAAAVFSVTVQASVPAPVIEPFAQLRPLRTGTPVPLSVTTEDDPVDELLLSVSWPVAVLATVGLNCTVSVAV